MGIKILKKNFFAISFTEGNSVSTLAIQCKSNIDILDNSNLLKSKSMSNNDISYFLADSNFDNLKRIISSLQSNKDIIKYDLEK